MAAATDILLDQENALAFRQGDFSTGFSDAQHQAHLLIAEKGNYNQSPTVGTGGYRYLNGTAGSEEIARDYRLELEKDGYSVLEISVRQSTITVQAERIR